MSENNEVKVIDETSASELRELIKEQVEFARTSNKCRCDTCQYEKNKIDTRNRVRLLREKKRM